MTIERDLARYISSVFDLYPGGVPERLFRKQESSSATEYRLWGGVSPSVLFVGVFSDIENEFSQAEGELLKAAILRGMQFDIQDISVLAFGDFPKANYMKEVVNSLITELAPESVCILGADLAQQYDAQLNKRGKFYSQNMYNLGYLHSIDEVLTSKEVKRKFWNDLQVLMSLIK